MNICHFICSQGLGRGEFYIDLVNELSLNSEVNITLLIPKNAKFLNRVSSNIKVLEYESKDSRNNPFLYLELFKILKNNKFDIVHTHFAKASEIFYKINKLLKIKHIATKHNPRKGKVFNKLDNVISVSKDVANSIRGKSKIIYNGISPIKFKKEKNQKEKFTIIAVGRLEKVKGFEYLISAMDKTAKEANLQIIGEGKERKNLEDLIKSLNLESRVELLGYREDIPSLLANSDIVVISSLSEGFSIVALEALFYSRLLISTEVGISKEILSKDLLIEKENIPKKINDIIANYATYENSFQCIKDEYCNEFLLTNVASNHIDFYKELLENEISSN